MGQSTDAEIAFGVDFGDDHPLLGEDEDEGSEDLGDYLAARTGLIDPDSEIPEEINYGSLDDFARWKDENPEWTKRTRVYRQKVLELEDEAPIEIIAHSSGEYPMYIVAIKGTHLVASRGYPKEFEPTALWVDAASISAAQKFCEEYEINTEDHHFEDPKWLLFSMWL